MNIHLIAKSLGVGGLVTIGIIAFCVLIAAAIINFGKVGIIAFLLTTIWIVVSIIYWVEHK